jgi:16S rRNA (cytidine1402-2'-O)-methyltransferase
MRRSNFWGVSGRLWLMQRRFLRTNLEVANSTGKLFVVATPIGNLEDVTVRAIKVGVVCLTCRLSESELLLLVTQILQSVDFVAGTSFLCSISCGSVLAGALAALFPPAEDTRHTVKLLSALGIQHKPLVSCHEHSSPGSINSIVTKIVGGSNVALVSDAGLPTFDFLFSFGLRPA